MIGFVNFILDGATVTIHEWCFLREYSFGNKYLLLERIYWKFRLKGVERESEYLDPLFGFSGVGS
jgi:hypothetical protein